jgi:FAD/FMN-containing dehydrogenase
MRKAMQELSGWGRVPRVPGVESAPEDLERGSAEVSLSRGLGRSYGDASLPAVPGGHVMTTRRADRILAFDPRSGVLRAEAGLSLLELNRLFPQRGWASPVQPGTQYITLGGMTASDVHGKNHHLVGSFGEHVRALRMRVPDGRVLEVNEASEPELFRATLGGMGLTGHILEVEVQLQPIPSPWIWGGTRPMRDLDELVETIRSESQRWPFTMAWGDCTARGAAMGRGILTVGRYAEPREAPREPPVMRERVAVPFDLPSWVVAPWSIRIFNPLYYHARRRLAHDATILHPQPFFYPLDAIRHWNRLYGKRGFSQYQCVLPLEQDGRAYRRFFDVLTSLGGVSPVAVVKDCGAEGRGLLSFPMPGITVALDLPFRPGWTQSVVDALNRVVIEAGGRIYLTKDALTRPEDLRRMEPRLDAFLEIRRKWDPDGRIRSAQSVRLMGDVA